MAVPSYGTDIVTLNGSVYTATGGTSLVLSDYATTGGGQSGISEETDFYLIGTECISKSAFGNGTQEKGIVDDTNAGGNIATTLASGNNPGGNQYVYIWMFFNAPASLASSVLPSNLRGGLHAIIGQNVTNYNAYSVSGSDLQDYGADWICGSIDVNVTPSNALTLTTVGNGAQGNYSIFGAGASIPTQGPTKGNPFAIEGIRRGAYIDAVEGEAASPVTFAGLEGFDGGDSANGRLGVFTERRGVYVLNTEVRLGSATQLCFMRDSSGATIRRQNDATPGYSNTETDGGKHRIQILNSSSDIEWQNVTILENAVDILINTTDNPTVNFISCSFFGVRLLQCGGTNTQLSRCTFGTTSATISTNTMAGTNTEARVIQNGSTITSCTVNGTSTTTETSGIEVSGTNAADLAKITNCNFTGDGRALLLGNISGGGEIEVIYNGHTYTPNAEGGYTDGATQASTSGPQGTSSAVIQCNVASGTTLKITVQNTNQIPSVFNEGTGNVIIEAAINTTVSGLLGNTEIVVLPTTGSPYSNNALNDTLNISTEVVSADTNTGDGGSNFISYSNNGGFVQINANGTNAFSNFPGVLQDTNSSSPRNLTAGDKVRVTIRDDTDNPTLELFDQFTVSGTPSSSAILTTTSFSGFTSVFGASLNSANSKTVTVEKVGARFQFPISANTQIDILAYRIGSNPIISLANTITTDSRSFPLSQIPDRVYKNPA